MNAAADAVAHVAYRAAWVAALIVASPALAGACIADVAHVRRRLWPRLGSGCGPSMWWHGSSAGEVRALAALKERVDAESDENASLDVRCTATTESGLAMWRAVGGGPHDTHILPVDMPYAWRRFVPPNVPDGRCLAVLSETELWPAMLDTLRRRGCPTMLAGARVSERTVGRLRRSRLMRRSACNMYVAAQTDADAERFGRLGVPADQVTVTGSLKWSARRPRPDEVAALRSRLALEADEPVVAAGSVRHDEIESLVGALGRLKQMVPRARVVVAPRFPADVGKAIALGTGAGWSVRTLSSFGPSRSDPEPQGGPRWTMLVVDTMGDLPLVYGIATAAAIGGSWVPVGGHNPFEAAVNGIGVVYGPHMEQPGCPLLEDESRAVRLEDWALLPETLAAMWREDPAARALTSLPCPIGLTLNAWRKWGLIATRPAMIGAPGRDDEATA